MRVRNPFLLLLIFTLGVTARATPAEHWVILPPDQAKATLLPAANTGISAKNS